MPRKPKPGEFINCKVSIDLIQKMNAYSEATRIPKTAIVEMALEEYLKKVMPEKQEKEKMPLDASDA